MNPCTKTRHWLRGRSLQHLAECCPVVVETVPLFQPLDLGIQMLGVVPEIQEAIVEAAIQNLRIVKVLLRRLYEKVEKNEQCLEDLQKRFSESGSAIGTSKKTKRVVPQPVRREVRKVYADLEEAEEDFSGWTISPGKSIKSPENQAVIQRLIKEVRGINPSFESVDIREAAYTFYKTRCEKVSAVRRGKLSASNTAKRRRERIVRKRIQRETAVLKNKRLTEDQRKKWMSVMCNDFMSSEESDDDDDNLIVHPLPWRTKYVKMMFQKIDDFNASKHSPQSRRQRVQRLEGTPSTRPFPAGLTDIPDWAVEKQS